MICHYDHDAAMSRARAITDEIEPIIDRHLDDAAANLTIANTTMVMMHTTIAMMVGAAGFMIEHRQDGLAAGELFDETLVRMTQMASLFKEAIIDAAEAARKSATRDNG